MIGTFDEVLAQATMIAMISGRVGVLECPNPNTDEDGYSIYYLGDGAVIEWVETLDEVGEVLTRLGIADAEWTDENNEEY